VIKFVALLLLFVLALSTPSAARELYRDLKAITAITYDAISHQDNKPCGVERESLATALQFVANQSVKLKLIPSREHDIRYQELNETQDQVWKQLTVDSKPETMFAALENAKFKAARDAAFDYGMMPILHIYISEMETVSGCVASISAEVNAYIDKKSRENLEILPTNRRVTRWTIEIWSTDHLIVSPRATYAAFVTRTVENVLKELVNDWTKAQDLEDLWQPPKQ
jgi:hypothetical protein